LSDWIRSHVVDVPNEFVEFCGDILRDAKALNVGCGEMLTDLGLLNLGAERITGLDVTSKDSKWLEAVANKVKLAGFDFPTDYKKRIKFVQYDGVSFPFNDSAFDVIFSWSAFEHVADVKPVLQEMKRVLAPGGQVFIQVFPWYNSRFGSHLTDYISEPFFQTKRSIEWVKNELESYVAKNPDTSSEFILNYMFNEYKNLNKLSPSRFYQEVVEAGFSVIKSRLISYDENLTNAPASVNFSDLMIGGTMMLMRAT
jgi:ubiquinone/menaquinone biosynthesis C-methylase UbiE